MHWPAFFDVLHLTLFIGLQVLVGTDSHTCTAGAFGQFASGIGNTDAGFVLGTGKILLKVCYCFVSGENGNS